VDIDLTRSVSRLSVFKADPAGDIAAATDVVRAFNKGGRANLKQAGDHLLRRLATSYGTVTVHASPTRSFNPPLIY